MALHVYKLLWHTFSVFILFSVSCEVTFLNLNTTIDVSSSLLAGNEIYRIRTNNDTATAVSMATVSTLFELDKTNSSTYV